MNIYGQGVMKLRYDLSWARLGQIARMLYGLYGVRAPWVIGARFSLYLFHLLWRRGKTFALDGRSYPYAFHLQNVTFRNERTVEIPIALEMLPWQGEILEVGNVLRQYVTHRHDVVDKYEVDEGVLNEDIVTYAPNKRYDLIVTVSTLEHVGWDEIPREPEKLLRALAHLKTLLRPRGQLLITVPIAQNPFLDEAIRQDQLGLSRLLFMRRLNWQNDWVQTSQQEALTCCYNEPYPGANAIAIGFYQALS